MGIYLNPGNDGFKQAIRSEIYVDKTGLTAYANRYLGTEQRFICVSRPRRFGKSMALKMLAAYYSCGCDSRELFAGRKIESDPSFEEHLNRYDMDFAEAGNWYDGYRFTEFRYIYNPKSVVEAMLRHSFFNYWTTTETYDALKVYMDMDYGGLRTDIVRMLGGEPAKVNTLSFRNDMRNFQTKDDVLTLLIHLGYLAYDQEKEEALQMLYFCRCLSARSLLLW